MDKKLWVIGLILGASLLGSAAILGDKFKNLRQQGTITVKGLAEEYHQADYAEWSVGVSVWGVDYGSALQKANTELELLKATLIEWGFKAEEMSVGKVEVSVYREEYKNDKGETEYRDNGYSGERYVYLSSKDLNKIIKAQESIQDLRAEKSNIRFGSPRYYLSNLEKIKLDMIGKATLDAKARAEQFVSASHATVGQMKRASQGSFSIYSATSQETDEDYGGSYSTETIDKKVRLVVTVEYGID